MADCRVGYFLPSTVMTLLVRDGMRDKSCAAWEDACEKTKTITSSDGIHCIFRSQNVALPDARLASTDFTRCFDGISGFSCLRFQVFDKRSGYLGAIEMFHR